MVAKKHLILLVMNSLLCVILATGCVNNLSPTLKDLGSLQEEIINTYKIKDVNLSLNNGNSLVLTFTNSQFNDLPEVQRKNKAREIALFAKKHYKNIDKVESIYISFAIHKKYFLIVDYKNNLDTFSFTKKELEKVPASSKPVKTKIEKI